MQQQEQGPPKVGVLAMVAGLGRLLCWWGLAELMLHLLYTHAICSSASLLAAIPAWTLGNRSRALLACGSREGPEGWSAVGGTTGGRGYCV